MNVSMIATPVAGDAGNGQTASVGKNDGGNGFGLAVKDAEQQHGGKAKSTEKAERHSKGEKKDDGAVEGGEKNRPDGQAEKPDGVSATGDLLGRLLGASFLPSSGPLVPSDGSATTAHAEEGSDGEIEERIIISTVADLAGAPAENEPKRVALRVTGMETHFEPHRDTPKLVDAEPTKTGAVANKTTGLQTPGSIAVGDGDAKGGVAVKAGFAEILRRLDTGRVDDTGTDAEPDAESDRREGQNAKSETVGARARGGTHRQSDSPSQAVAEKPWTVGSDRARTSSSASFGNGPSMGQAINTQLAERIVGAFAERPSSSSDTAAPSQPGSGQLLRLTAGGGALKTLSIQLEPQDLGRVDVSMRLIDGRLTVELAASEPSTAATLAGDRHGLRKILEHAGFALDDAAITIVARDVGTVPSSSSAPSNGDGAAGRQSASQDQAFGNSGSERKGAEQQSSGRRRSVVPDGRADEKSPLRDGRAGSVYL